MFGRHDKAQVYNILIVKSERRDNLRNLAKDERIISLNLKIKGYKIRLNSTDSDKSLMAATTNPIMYPPMGSKNSEGFLGGMELKLHTFLNSIQYGHECLTSYSGPLKCTGSRSGRPPGRVRTQW